MKIFALNSKHLVHFGGVCKLSEWLGLDPWVKVSRMNRLCKILFDCLHTLVNHLSHHAVVLLQQEMTQKRNAFWSRCVSWVNTGADSVPSALGGGISWSSHKFYGLTEQHLRWLRGFPWGEVSNGMLWDYWNAGIAVTMMPYKCIIFFKKRSNFSILSKIVFAKLGPK